MKVKWKSTFNVEMNHMTPAGIRGFDVYTLVDGNKWEFMGPARPVVNKKNSTATVFANNKPGMREYMMFFAGKAFLSREGMGTMPDQVRRLDFLLGSPDDAEAFIEDAVSGGFDA